MCKRLCVALQQIKHRCDTIELLEACGQNVVHLDLMLSEHGLNPIQVLLNYLPVILPRLVKFLPM